MPLYTYKCPECGTKKDGYNTVSNRNSGPLCAPCHGVLMELTIVPVNIAPILGGGDCAGYMCPVTDTFVTSRRERRNIMAQHNLVEAGDAKPSKARQAKTEATYH